MTSFSIDTLTAAFIGNAVGILLIFTLFFSSIGRAMERHDTKNTTRLLIVAGLSCIVDPLMYVIDGRPGFIYTVLVYLGNSWLYIANLFMSRIWIDFIVNHLNITLSKTHKRVVNALEVVGIIGVFVNFILPCLFRVTDNVYERLFGYYIYVIIAGIFIADGAFIYYIARKRGGEMRFFPVAAFIAPIVIGVALQSMFYGVSVIWASIAVSIAGVMTALKNEIIFFDKLTGIYNRTYLDELQKGVYRNHKTQYITGVMLDLNDFKSINDRFGHGTGDDALINTAEILRKTVGALGSVIRYAGDEFVILLNTVDEKIINQTINDINAAFVEFNKTSGSPYELSASMGYSSLDLKNQSMNEFMNTIDKRMYESKAKYHVENNADQR